MLIIITKIWAPQLLFRILSYRVLSLPDPLRSLLAAALLLLNHLSSLDALCTSIPVQPAGTAMASAPALALS